MLALIFYGFFLEGPYKYSKENFAIIKTIVFTIYV